MTQTSTDRERMMLAFAELERHGILACGALAGNAEQGHGVLRARLAARYPHGTGSYVFWTRSDDRFDAAGDLTAVLALHCSTEEVAGAVAAACANAGIAPQPDDDAAVLRLAPRRQASARDAAALSAAAR
jgi:hypothetical protein